MTAEPPGTHPDAAQVRWPASAGSSAHVFVSSLTEDLDVGGDDGHHLARVLRLRPGEVVTAADGRGAWRAYEVASAGGAAVRLRAAGPPAVEPELHPRLAIAFALTKGDKPELTVQKLTELGVDRILPVLAERSVSRPGADRVPVLSARWRKVALEAARQCRRARLPDVGDLSPLAALAGHPGLVVAEWSGGPVAAAADPPGGELVVVVGPEGGLSQREVAALGPWRRVSLGPHVLRAETAALAAAALLGAARPDAAPPAGAELPEPE